MFIENEGQRQAFLDVMDEVHKSQADNMDVTGIYWEMKDVENVTLPGEPGLWVDEYVQLYDRQTEYFLSLVSTGELDLSSRERKYTFDDLQSIYNNLGAHITQQNQIQEAPIRQVESKSRSVSRPFEARPEPRPFHARQKPQYASSRGGR